MIETGKSIQGSSRLRPILDDQTWNPLKVTRVGRHKSASVVECGRRNDQVCVTVRVAALSTQDPEIGSPGENRIGDWQRDRSENSVNRTS